MIAVSWFMYIPPHPHNKKVQKEKVEKTKSKLRSIYVQHMTTMELTILSST